MTSNFLILIHKDLYHLPSVYLSVFTFSHFSMKLPTHICMHTRTHACIQQYLIPFTSSPDYIISTCFGIHLPLYKIPCLFYTYFFSITNSYSSFNTLIKGHIVNMSLLIFPSYHADSRPSASNSQLGMIFLPTETTINLLLSIIIY